MIKFIGRKLVSFGLIACLVLGSSVGVFGASSKVRTTVNVPVKCDITKAVSKKPEYLTVKWVKQKVTGYQIKLVYTVKNTGSKYYRYLGVSNKYNFRTIKGLKQGRKYTVRVRAFNKIGKKRSYGKWSEPKNVVVKKKKMHTCTYINYKGKDGVEVEDSYLGQDYKVITKEGYTINKCKCGKSHRVYNTDCVKKGMTHQYIQLAKSDPVASYFQSKYSITCQCTKCGKYIVKFTR